MHHRLLLRLLAACVVLTSLALRAQTPGAAAPKVTGGAELILVAKVNGTATMTVDGATTPLAVDVKVPQSAKINTLKNSSVVLVFSNGATTQLGAESEMVIQEFLQDPFAGTIAMATITDEPSISTTRLKLNHGELVGKVAHLKHDKGSTFVVETPVGAAGIRGTTFQIVFRPNGTGQAFFQLSTVEGSVAFGQPSGVTAQGTANVPVPTGQAITVTVDVTTNAQGVTVVTVIPPVTTTGTISPTVAAQVTQVAADIAVATQQTAFAPPAAGGSGTNGGTTTNSAPKSPDAPPPTPGTPTPTPPDNTQKPADSAPKKADISGADFTGTVTVPAPRVTNPDGRPPGS